MKSTTNRGKPSLIKRASREYRHESATPAPSAKELCLSDEQHVSGTMLISSRQRLGIANSSESAQFWFDDGVTSGGTQCARRQGQEYTQSHRRYVCVSNTAACTIRLTVRVNLFTPHTLYFSNDLALHLHFSSSENNYLGITLTPFVDLTFCHLS